MIIKVCKGKNFSIFFEKKKNLYVKLMEKFSKLSVKFNYLYEEILAKNSTKRYEMVKP